MRIFNIFIPTIRINILTSPSENRLHNHKSNHERTFGPLTLFLSIPIPLLPRCLSPLPSQPPPPSLPATLLPSPAPPPAAASLASSQLSPTPTLPPSFYLPRPSLRHEVLAGQPPSNPTAAAASPRHQLSPRAVDDQQQRPSPLLSPELSIEDSELQYWKACNKAADHSWKTNVDHLDAYYYKRFKINNWDKHGQEKITNASGSRIEISDSKSYHNVADWGQQG
ncbi:hypothetical protein AKJ16_DCAP00200 [Drosera capensis]